MISFVMDGIHPHDIGTILDQEGIAVRTGHHCAQPVMDRFGIPATVRASFGLYNTREEIDALVAGIQKVRKISRLTADLRDIYQEVILEHAKSARNSRALKRPTVNAEGYNRLSGDRCTVYVSLQGDVMEDIGFQGSGCTISRASASSVELEPNVGGRPIAVGIRSRTEQRYQV